MDRRKIVAIVPARAGSKGFPKKNIQKLGGKTLIDIAIEQGKAVGETVIVSTDISKADIKSNAEFSYYRRPDALCTDNSNMADVVTDVIENHVLHDKFILLLQPTSPLRSNDILKEITKNTPEAKEMYLTVVKTEFNTHKSGTIRNGELIAHKCNSDFFKNRQELETTYKPNGAAYFFRAQDFIDVGSFDFSKLTALEMTLNESIDIDSRSDLDLCASYLRENL